MHKDLKKLKKIELLEILLAQGREIDRLREMVESLEERLENKEIIIQNAGSIAQASLELTKIFEEAQKAADLYLYNIQNLK